MKRISINHVTILLKGKVITKNQSEQLETKIHSLKFGINRCYIIQSEGTIMVDGGPPNKKNDFLKQLNKLNIDPKRIQLIILTHGHFDHIGSALDFKEITETKVAIHKNDKMNLEKGTMEWAPGVTSWGKNSRFVFKPLLAGKTIPTLKPDIVLNDKDFELNDYGIEGKIIFTPGHSAGSVSVVLDTGEAFVGCMAQNGWPFTIYPRLPIYASSKEQLNSSWKKIVKFGVSTIYPGHGNPFSVHSLKIKYNENTD